MKCHGYGGGGQYMLVYRSEGLGLDIGDVVVQMEHGMVCRT